MHFGRTFDAIVWACDSDRIRFRCCLPSTGAGDNPGGAGDRLFTGVYLSLRMFEFRQSGKKAQRLTTDLEQTYFGARDPTGLQTVLSQSALSYCCRKVLP